MKVSAIRIVSVRVLIICAKLLAFLDSLVFDIVLKVSVLVGFVYVLVLNGAYIGKSYMQLQSNVKLAVWYKTLPADYSKKLSEESDSALVRYQEWLKPKPPKKVLNTPLLGVSAKSYIIIDVPTNTVLGSKDAGVALPPASTAKLATALASLKLYKLNEEITVPQFCTQVDGTKAEFSQGQRFLVGDLLKALLVYSSADAGCVLSIGKSSYASFIALMNEVAKEANLQNSKFTNPIGLDDTDGQNLASAEDLAKLGEAAVKNDFIKEVVRLKEFELKSLDGSYSKKLINTNKLLTDIPETVGIKTGTTGGAGEVLIYEYQKESVDLIIVVMGSSDRFTDTKTILNWALQSFSWM